MIKLNGIKLASEIEKQIIAKTASSNVRLDIIQVGNEYSSSIYIKRKIEACNRLNIKTKLWRFKDDVKQEKLMQLIDRLNKKADVNGILIQLPLPKHLNTNQILNAIDLKKDVDVFNKKTLELKNKKNESPVPCLVGAIEAFAKKYKISFKNKKIVVIGKGKTGGAPIIAWYKKFYDVTALDKNSKNIDKHISHADILISAIGKHNVIDASLIKKGAAFFDIGITRQKNKKSIIGDIDYKLASKQAKWGTPVPGGIGPMTIMMLIKNLIILSELQNE